MSSLFYLDVFSVMLALFALFGMGAAYKNSRRKLDKVKIYFASLACMLLIISQTSWIYYHHVAESLEVSSLANLLRTVFDITVMIVFTLFNNRARQVR